MIEAAGPLRDRAITGLIFALGPLVALALYLPGGVLMPFRLAVLALIGLLTWRYPRCWLSPASLIVLLIGCVLGAFALLGSLRFPGHTDWTEFIGVGFAVATSLALIWAAGERTNLLALLAGWLSAAILCAAVGLWELITRGHLPGNVPAEYWSSRRPGFLEIAAFFDNPNLYAYHIVVVLLLLPVLLRFWPKWWWALTLGLFAVLQIVLLWWTTGRIALLTLVLGVAVWLFRGRAGWLVAAFGALTGVTAWLGVAPGSTLLRFATIDQITLEGSSLWVRLLLARSGLWTMARTGYLGAGPGGFEVWALDPENPHRYAGLNNAHSGLMELAVNYGLISAALVLAVLLWASVRAIISSIGRDQLRRACAWAVLVLTLTLPTLAMSHSTWIKQPLTSLHLATLCALVIYVCGASSAKDEGTVPGSSAESSVSPEPGSAIGVADEGR